MNTTAHKNQTPPRMVTKASTVIQTAIITLILLAAVVLLVKADESPKLSHEVSPISQAILAAEVTPAPASEAVPTVPAIPTSTSGIVEQLVGALGGKAGWITALLAWVGALRFMFKPTMSWLHSLVEATPTTRDDAILAKIEASKALKAITWLIDLLASVKIGPQKPIPPAVEK